VPRPTKAGEPASKANKKVLGALNLRPPKRGTVIERSFYTWDAHTRGLGLRTQVSGSRSYYAVYRHRGRRCSYFIGNAASISLEAARKIAGRVVQAAAEGRDMSAERKAERAAGTFKQLHEDYLRRHAKKANKSWAQSDFLVRKYLLPAWGDTPAKEVTRADIRRVLAKVEESPAHRTQVKAAASAVFSWALSEDLVALNPCSGIKTAKSTERERILSSDELPLVWGAFDSAGLVRSAALRMILLTGARPGEVEAMRFEHVRDGWWTQPGAPEPKTGWPGTKNGASHSVFLSPEVRAVIDAVHDGAWPVEGFVFPSSRRGNHVADLAGAMRKICANLKIESKLTPHDLRRSAASTITALQFTEQDMDRILNHQRKRIGRVYNRHDYRKENQAIWEALGRRVIEIAEGRPAANVVPMGRGRG
jgi:integrase